MRFWSNAIWQCKRWIINSTARFTLMLLKDQKNPRREKLLAESVRQLKAPQGLRIPGRSYRSTCAPAKCVRSIIWGDSSLRETRKMMPFFVSFLLIRPQSVLVGPNALEFSQQSISSCTAGNRIQPRRRSTVRRCPQCLQIAKWIPKRSLNLYLPRSASPKHCVWKCKTKDSIPSTHKSGHRKQVQRLQTSYRTPKTFCKLSKLKKHFKIIIWILFYLPANGELSGEQFVRQIQVRLIWPILLLDFRKSTKSLWSLAIYEVHRVRWIFSWRRTVEKLKQLAMKAFRISAVQQVNSKFDRLKSSFLY